MGMGVGVGEEGTGGSEKEGRGSGFRTGIGEWGERVRMDGSGETHS